MKMDMRQNTVYLLAAAMLLLPACQQEEKDNLAFGEKTITARFADEPQDTKTSYDGDSSIDNFSWDAGDQIAVLLSDGNTYNAYDIVTVYPDTDPKTGKFVCSTTGSIRRDFYAVFPAAAADEGNYGNPTLNVILPDEYDITGKGNDYAPVPMVASNRDTDTELDFYHVGGLLRLTLNELHENTQKIRVTFDKYVVGSFAVSNPGGANPSITTPDTPGSDNGKSVAFKVAENAIGENPSPVVLNIPVPCGTYNKVDVEMVDKNGTSLSVLSFEMVLCFNRHHGKKLFVKELEASFSLDVTLDDFDTEGSSVLESESRDIVLTLDKYKFGEVVGHAPWKAYFYSSKPEVGDLVSPDWSEAPLTDSQGNDWLTMSAYEGGGDSDEVTVTIAKAAWAVAPGRNLNIAAQRMYNEWQSAAAVSNLDLSTYDFMTGDTGACETANCYVIQNHGSYLIPCVYGNAYGNSRAYTTSTASTEDNPVLGHFLNADGNPIQNAVITSDSNLDRSDFDQLVARVVWQDVLPGYEILSDSDLEFVSTPGTAANCPYIRVNFQKEKMAPGNIVIALYDKGKSKVLWSWHLWVTREAFSTMNVLQQDNTTSNTFLNVNLGWTPPISYYGGRSVPRDQYVIIVSTENQEVVGSFHVSQGEYVQDDVICDAYSNTFYQWGRKDPFLPSVGNSNYNRPNSFSRDFGGNVTYTDLNLPVGYVASSEGVEAAFGFMIRNPHLFFTNLTSYPKFMNLWNIDNNQITDVAVTKTIYDPCPRGFHLPRRNAFTGFILNGMQEDHAANIFGTFLPASADDELPAGWKFTTTHSAGNYDFFISLAGSRDRNNSNLVVVAEAGFYVTACLESNYIDMVIYETSILTLHGGGRNNALIVRPCR